jgi:UDP-glucuronate decarboxylase
MKTIMITGASGLVGSHLVAKAKSEGMNVVAVTRKNYGDLTEIHLPFPNADYIVHAAGYGQPARYMADPIKTIKLNTTVTTELFERLNPGGKFLFVSSAEVYSGLYNTPFKEDFIGGTNTDHPRACYIEGKRCGEAITLIRGGKVARLALAYGPGTKSGDRRVIEDFISQGLDGAIRPIDSGRAHRTYCYVTDAVEMMWDILMYGKESVYNVGGDSGITIRALANKIGKMMKVPVKFPNESRGLIGAPSDVCVSISRYENEFGKRDFVPLDEGLARTIAWRRKI